MNKCGGRGQCKYCGEWYNNVAYHSAQDCVRNTHSFVSQQAQAGEAAYHEVLIPEPTFPPNTIQAESKNTPHYMGLILHCHTCQKQLQTPGALVFSPLATPNSTRVEKYHVCLDCWETMCDIFNFPFEFPRKPIQ